MGSKNKLKTTEALDYIRIIMSSSLFRSIFYIVPIVDSTWQNCTEQSNIVSELNILLNTNFRIWEAVMPPAYTLL